MLARALQNALRMPAPAAKVEPVPVTDEEIIHLRQLKANGLPLKEARLIAIPNSSESYAAALWSGARRAHVRQVRLENPATPA